LASALSVLAATFSGLGAARSQDGGTGMPGGSSRRQPDYDEVEQKPLSSDADQRSHTEEVEAAKQRQAAEEAPVTPVAPDAVEPYARFEFGVRTGVAIPIGQATSDATADLNSLVSSQVPVWADVGARFRGGVFFGLHASYGFGMLAGGISDLCDQARAAGAAVNCHASDARAGIEVLYHLRPMPAVDLWFGGGLGWEWLSFGSSETLQGQAQSVSLSANGMQLVMLQAGADFEPLRGLGVGPFIAFSNDMYFTDTTTCQGVCGGVATGSRTIDNKSLHHWLFFGARVSWRP
jgi:hypothetical protein